MGTGPQQIREGIGKRSEVLIDLSKGVDAAGKLQVTTSYLGRWADHQRQELANDNPQKRRASYANYIADYYPGAKMSAPLDISDDKVHNIIKVSEHYDLPQTFTVKNGRRRFFLQADELYRYAGSLKSSVRTSPLAIAYPADVQQTIRVILPKKWDVSDDTVQIDNPAFHYVSTIKYIEQSGFPQLVLDYRYRSLTDVVEVAALDQYLKDRRRLDDDLGFYIREPRPPASSANTTRVVFRKPVALAPEPKWLMVIALIAGVFAALRHGYRWNPVPKWIDPAWPVGIRGWLSLFAALAVGSAIMWPFLLWDFASNLEVDVWVRLPGTVRAVLLLFAIAGVLLQVALVLTTILFFKKRSSTPLLMIGTHCATAAWSFTSQIYAAAHHLLGNLSIGDVLWNKRFAWVGVVLYIGYFTLSKRVKATFVARYQPPHEAQPVSAGPKGPLVAAE
jgi:hypothetical protein